MPSSEPETPAKKPWTQMNVGPALMGITVIALAGAMIFAHFNNDGPSDAEVAAKAHVQRAPAPTAHLVTTWECAGYATLKFSDKGTFVALSDNNYRAAGQFRRDGDEIGMRLLVNLNDKSAINEYSQFKIQESGSSVVLTETVRTHDGEARPVHDPMDCQVQVAPQQSSAQAAQVQAPAQQVQAPAQQVEVENEARVKLFALYQGLRSSQNPQCDSVATEVAKELAEHQDPRFERQNSAFMEMAYSAESTTAQRLGCL